MDWTDPKPAPEPLALVQDFINTANRLHGTDRLGTLEEATTLLTARGLLEAGEDFRESDRQRLVAFREAIRGLLLVHTSLVEPSRAHPADPEGLESLADQVALQVSFGSDGRPTLKPSSQSRPVDRVAGRILAVMATTEAAGNWQRLKACRNEECLWAFYDSSKNRSGRWCDMDVCGVRHKMRTYRKRKTELR